MRNSSRADNVEESTENNEFIDDLGRGGIRRLPYTIPENRLYMASMAERSAFILANANSIDNSVSNLISPMGIKSALLFLSVLLKCSFDTYTQRCCELQKDAF